MTVLFPLSLSLSPSSLTRVAPIAWLAVVANPRATTGKLTTCPLPLSVPSHPHTLAFPHCPMTSSWWQSERWFVGLVLQLCCLVGTMAVLPYACCLQSIPLTTKLVLLTALNTFIVWPVVLGLSLYFLHSSLQHVTPVLVAAYHSTATSALAMHRDELLTAAAIGCVVGAVILALDPLLKLILSLPEWPADRSPSAWQGLLASLYGATVEEILFRFFFHTLLVSGLTHLTSSHSIAFSVAAAVSAVGFGLGHVPAARKALEGSGERLGWTGVLRVVLLNCLASVPFALVYEGWGLEAAMVTHGATDIVLHVIAPLFVHADAKPDKQD